MSAFMCTPRHLNALVTYADNMNLLGKMDHAAALKLLVRANVRSLKARYSDVKDMVPNSRYVPENVMASDIGASGRRQLATFILKAADCFDYQACESDAWTIGDKACHLIERIRACALEDGASYKDDDYNNAPWSL